MKNLKGLDKLVYNALSKDSDETLVDLMLNGTEFESEMAKNILLDRHTGNKEAIDKIASQLLRALGQAIEEIVNEDDDSEECGCDHCCDELELIPSHCYKNQFGEVYMFVIVDVKEVTGSKDDFIVTMINLENGNRLCEPKSYYEFKKFLKEEAVSEFIPLKDENVVLEF